MKTTCGTVMVMMKVMKKVMMMLVSPSKYIYATIIVL